MIGTPDNTAERINAIARVLRYRHHFKGYIHLKVIPGCSAAAIEEAVSLASAVSLNIETPGAENLSKLSGRKDYMRDIIEPMKLISRLTGRGCRFQRVKQTTQFIVGAAEEDDRQIIRYMGGLYDRLGAEPDLFQCVSSRGLGASDLPAERTQQNPRDILTREHRLYQVDFLMRKYGFKDDEISFDGAGRCRWRRIPRRFGPDCIRSGSR